MKRRAWPFVLAMAGAYILWRIVFATVIEVLEEGVRAAFGLGPKKGGHGHGGRWGGDE